MYPPDNDDLMQNPKSLGRGGSGSGNQENQCSVLLSPKALALVEEPSWGARLARPELGANVMSRALNLCQRSN